MEPRVERRKKQRFRIKNWASIRFGHKDVACHLVDLSSSGAFLETPPEFSYDSGELILQETSAGGKMAIPFVVVRKVYWENFSPLGAGRIRGIGVKFDKLLPQNFILTFAPKSGIA